MLLLTSYFKSWYLVIDFRCWFRFIKMILLLLSWMEQFVPRLKTGQVLLKLLEEPLLFLSAIKHLSNHTMPCSILCINLSYPRWQLRRCILFLTNFFWNRQIIYRFLLFYYVYIYLYSGSSFWIDLSATAVGRRVPLLLFRFLGWVCSLRGLANG